MRCSDELACKPCGSRDPAPQAKRQHPVGSCKPSTSGSTTSSTKQLYLCKAPDKHSMVASRFGLRQNGRVAGAKCAAH